MFKNLVIGFTLLSAMACTAHAQPPWWRPQDLPGATGPHINDRTPNTLYWIRITNATRGQWRVVVDGCNRNLFPGQSMVFQHETGETGGHEFTIDCGSRRGGSLDQVQSR